MGRNRRSVRINCRAARNPSRWPGFLWSSAMAKTIPAATTLKEAIASAQKGEVAIYTVSTKEEFDEDPSEIIGAHALKDLAELTGGATFVPGSVRRLSGSLKDLQQVIRGRYFVSYKPAKFQRNGRYRSIQITAQKGGHPLKVYARTGYYALTPEPETTQ